MKTIILYKVIYFDSYGDYSERDFQELSDAQSFALTVQHSKVYKYEIVGNITEVV